MECDTYNDEVIIEDWDECEPMSNPNLFVTLAESVESGYILAENGDTILSENMLDTISYG